MSQISNVTEDFFYFYDICKQWLTVVTLKSIQWFRIILINTYFYIVQVICATFVVICSLFHKSMKLGTIVQVRALNSFRNGAIAKTPRGCHGDHFTFRHNQIINVVSYLLNSGLWSGAWRELRGWSRHGSKLWGWSELSWWSCRIPTLTLCGLGSNISILFTYIINVYLNNRFLWKHHYYVCKHQCYFSNIYILF